MILTTNKSEATRSHKEIEIRKKAVINHINFRKVAERLKLAQNSKYGKITILMDSSCVDLYLC